jgi:hypothetical protein
MRKRAPGLLGTSYRFRAKRAPPTGYAGVLRTGFRANPYNAGMTRKIPTPRFSKQYIARRLRILLGTWKLEGRFVGGVEPLEERGTVAFRWVEKDALLAMRSRTTVAPVSISVIGADDGAGNFTVLYSDARRVVRRYEMTLTRRRWTMSRRAKGFNQRFVGNLSANGRKIVARWEKSADGRRWMKDFDLLYTKR